MFGLNAKDLIEVVGEEHIYRMYDPNFILNKALISPIRPDDRNPSFNYNVFQGRIYWKDWGIGLGGDIFDFVQTKFKIEFKEACDKIVQDFGYGYIPPPKQINLKKETKKSSLLQIIVKDWTEEELDYWKIRYGLDKIDLQREHIYSVGEVWYNKQSIYLPEKLNFGYYFPETKEVKLYTPFSKNKARKWLGSVSTKLTEGMNDLDFSKDTVFVQKSRKDRIVMKKLFPQFNVVNTQNEDSKSITSKDMEKLLQFPKRFTFWDSDDAGVNAAKGLNEKGFKWINVPKIYKGCKDISDLIEKYGADKTVQIVLNEIIKKQ